MHNALDEARALIRKLDVLGGGDVVLRRAAARALGELDAVDAARLLEGLIQLAQSRWPPALKVLPQVLQSLVLDGDLLPHREQLRQVATLHQHGSVQALLGEGQPVETYDAQAAAKADAKLFSLPLGVLKSKARLTRNADELSSLAAASHPHVVRELLNNARMTEALVVRIAARRPARAEALQEIWRSRWSRSAEVRKALVWNPYLSPAIALKVLPLLPRSILKEMASSQQVHPLLRELAFQLIASADAR